MAVDPTELADIQADLAAVVCNLACTIQRKTKTPDGLGSATETWTTVSVNGLKAGMSQPSEQLLTNYGYRLEALNTWLIKLPYNTKMTDGTALQAQDHLIISAKSTTYTLEAHVQLDPRSYPGLDLWLAAQLKP